MREVSVTAEAERRRQPDGRSKRWDEHREQRRAGIVEAGLAAVEEYGVDVGVYQIAKSAKISRTVLYRYFSDKDDLFQAMAASLSQHVVGVILGSLENETQPRRMVFATLDSVTTWVDEHSMLYQFLRLRASGTASEMRYVEQSVANTLAQLMAAILTWLGADPKFSGLGAQAIVGMVENSVSWWVTQREMSREEVTEQLSDFIWDAITGYLKKIGVDLDPDAPLPTEITMA